MSSNQAAHGDIILGLMSGTSADGLDIAICNVQSQNQISLIEAYSFPYPDNLRKQITALQVSATTNNLESLEIKKLDKQLANFVIQACQESIEKSPVNHNDIKAIANHGQTILHQPNAEKPFSLQIGNAQHIANSLRLTVINDFRKNDIQAGGQGAPLIPAFHQAVFQQYAPCNIINIGGIANITSLDSNKVLGFDTGPGNTLLDQWNQQHNKSAYDKNGDWARSGNCQPTLLAKLLNDPYFSAPHPKSTGQDLFNLNWLNKRIQSLPNYQLIAASDIQNTLSQLTADSIALSIQELGHTDRPIYLCGGGVHNTYLVEQLQTALPEASINSTADIGIDPNWVEAIGFAWLGYCRLNDIPTNMPAVTGATSKVCLGSISQPNI